MKGFLDDEFSSIWVNTRENFYIMDEVLIANLPGGCTWNDFYTSCLSPFSLRKGLNVRVNPGPRIFKKGCFFKLFRYFRKKGSFFLNNDENNSSDNLYRHSDKKKHIVWLLTIDFSKI